MTEQVIDLSAREPLTVDFESKPIRPHKPAPVPVGCSLRWPGGRCEYLAWGHPTGNNCTKEEGYARVRDAIANADEVIFHNAKIDLMIFWRHISPEGKDLAWKRVHDTQFLIILNEPYAPTLALKPTAERLFGMASVERDEVFEWLEKNCKAEIEAEWKIQKTLNKQAKRSKAVAALIGLAPGSLVGKYAIGDVERTFRLWVHLYPKVQAAGMQGAYDLERRMLQPLTRMEMRGFPIAKNIDEVIARVKKNLDVAMLRVFEKVGEYVDIGGPSLGKALVRKGMVSGLARTAPSDKFPLGQVSLNKESLNAAQFKDPALRELILYWRGWTHAVNTNLIPWRDTQVKGRIYTTFFQTQGTNPGDDKPGGARTLRLSCAWLLNMVKERKFRYDLIPGLEKLPSPREMLMPEDGFSLILERDWKQQEFRVAAHFEGGELMARYLANPWMDIHDDNTALVRARGYDYSRDTVKMVGLAILYALGAEKMAIKLKLSLAETKMLRMIIKATVPDLVQLTRTVQAVEQEEGSIRTYMGAKLTREPSETRDFGYKLFNALVQRSSAEAMKETVAKWHEGGYNEKWPWYVSIHDSNRISANEDNWREGARELDQVMRSGGFDVAMLSDLSMGPNFGLLAKIPEPRT